MNTEKYRIKNLEFRPCTYIGELPKHISFEIVKYYPNDYYGTEDNYEKDGNYYYDSSHIFRIHESCFKSKENCYTILIFRYSETSQDYVAEFVSDRYLDLDDKEWKILREILSIVNKYLNKYIYEN